MNATHRAFLPVGGSGLHSAQRRPEAARGHRAGNREEPEDPARGVLFPLFGFHGFKRGWGRLVNCVCVPACPRNCVPVCRCLCVVSACASIYVCVCEWGGGWVGVFLGSGLLGWLVLWLGWVVWVCSCGWVRRKPNHKRRLKRLELGVEHRARPWGA